MVASNESSLFVRRIIVTLIVVLISFGGGHLLLKRLAALKKPPERIEAGTPLPLVRVVQLEALDHQESVRGYGTARALREARVSAQVGGLVAAVDPGLEAGRRVRPPKHGAGSKAIASKPLVRIDRADLDDVLARLGAERNQARAERARTEAEIRNLESQLEVSDRRLRTTRLELERILRLVPATLTESDADRQRLAVFALEQMHAELVSRRDTAQASLAVVDARLEVIGTQERKAQRDLMRTSVYAPFAGIVVARHVETGALVSPGTPLFDLLDPTNVEVAVALPASRHGHVRSDADGEGSAIVLRLAEGGDPLWTGSIRRVDPTIDSASRTFRAYAEVSSDEGPTSVVPGAHIVADVAGRTYPNVLEVPREAFLDGRVFIVEATDDPDTWIAQRRQPRVVARLAGIVLVAPGEGDTDLRSGDRVVVTNLEDVAEGSKLRTLESPTANEPQ